MTATATEPTIDQFHIQQEVEILASPERVFEALTSEIHHWWFECTSPGAKMVIEAQVGGRFFEDAGSGEGVHGRLVHDDKSKRLVRSVAAGDQTEAHIGEIGLDLRVFHQQFVGPQLPDQCLGIFRLLPLGEPQFPQVWSQIPAY